MATEELSTVLMRAREIESCLKDNKRPDLQEIKKMFKALDKSSKKVISESNLEEMKQAFEVLCELMSKAGDLVTAVGERSYHESKRNSGLEVRNENLAEEIDALKKVITELKKDNEDLKKKMKYLEGDENTLILGQMLVKVEKGIISKLIPRDIRDYFSIFNLRSFFEVLDRKSELSLDAFEDETSYDELVDSWKKLQKHLGWERSKHKQFVSHAKKLRNETAHRFDLQEAKSILENYPADPVTRSKYNELMKMYEKLYPGQQ